MNGLERAILTLDRYSASRSQGAVDVRAQLLVTLGFIVAVLTVPLTAPGRMVWFLCYPIVMAEVLGIGYGRLFLDSLWVLPLILLIAVFNPILDRVPVFTVSGLVITRGWVTFAGVILRGLLTVQALLLLVRSSGFNDMCMAFARLGVPKVLVAQLLMLYRYVSVMLSEALTMHRARQARGFGRKDYPLRMWGVFAGQLLMRSIDRARRVNRAMLARGFDGTMPYSTERRPLRLSDWAYLAIWTIVLLAVRFCDLTAIIVKLIPNTGI